MSIANFEAELEQPINEHSIENEVDMPDFTMSIANFEAELEQLINKHSIENEVDMPDFILAQMICRMIEAMGPSIKRTLDWHGCASVCHPGPSRLIQPEVADGKLKESEEVALGVQALCQQIVCPICKQPAEHDGDGVWCVSCSNYIYDDEHLLREGG